MLSRLKICISIYMFFSLKLLLGNLCLKVLCDLRELLGMARLFAKWMEKLCWNLPRKRDVNLFCFPIWMTFRLC